MYISSLLRDLVFDGQMQLECPKGSINLSASKADGAINVNFDNPPTFRYFLGSLPQAGSSNPRQQLRYLEQLPQGMQVHIAGKPLLEKPASGSIKVYYWRAGRELVRWKLGL